MNMDCSGSQSPSPSPQPQAAAAITTHHPLPQNLTLPYLHPMPRGWQLLQSLNLQPQFFASPEGLRSHPPDPEQPDQFNSPFNLLRALASSETASSGGGSVLLAFAGLNTAAPLSFSCKNHYLKSQGEFPPSSAQLSIVSFNFILFHTVICVQAALFLSGSCSIFTIARSCVSTRTPRALAGFPRSPPAAITPCRCRAMILVPCYPDGESPCCRASRSQGTPKGRVRAQGMEGVPCLRRNKYHQAEPYCSPPPHPGAGTAPTPRRRRRRGIWEEVAARAQRLGAHTPALPPASCRLSFHRATKQMQSEVYRRFRASGRKRRTPTRCPEDLPQGHPPAPC